MGALDRFLRRGRQQDGGYKPLMNRLEAAMLAACRAAGASAWYVADDYLVLGPELVPSGAFDSSAGWTLGGGWAISGGKLTATAAATGSNSVINAGLVAGKSYLVAYDIDSISAGATTPIANGATSTQQTTSGQKVSIITPAESSGNVGLNSSSATALTASFDNFSVREILSAKDFQDSAGTLPSYLGGTVGLLYAGTGTVSNELVPDPELNAPSKWTTQAGYSMSSGKVVASAAAQSSYVRSTDNVVVAGKTYEFTITCTAYASGQFRLMTEGLVTVIASQSTAGKFRAVATPTTTGRVLIYSANATPLNAEFESVSVKEITGNHVTQATAGNRPLVSRIPRKLGPELVTNGGFNSDASGWTPFAASGNSTIVPSSGAALVTAGGTGLGAQQQVGIVAGKTYQVSGSITFGSGSGAVIAIANVAQSALLAAGPSVTSGSANISYTFTATEDNSRVYLRAGNTAGATATYDNVSVREVLEWSYVLTFDGTNDSLASATSVIGATLTQPYTMISAFRVGQVSLGQRTQGDTGRWIGLGSSNKLVATHAGGATLDGTSDVAVGDLVIQEVVWDGAAVKIWRNGVLEASGAMAAPTGVTPGAHNIGQNGGGTYFKGEKVLDVVCPAVMTDAQRLAVRKFAAAQMGLVL